MSCSCHKGVCFNARTAGASVPLNLAVTAATRTGLRVEKRVYGVGLGRFVEELGRRKWSPRWRRKQWIEAVALTANEREGESTERKVEGRDPVKKLPVQSTLLYFFFFLNLAGMGRYQCIAQCLLFLTSNFISIMFFVWWPSCGTGFLLLRAEGRHCFWFPFFCLHTVPFLVMPLGSIITVIEPTVQYAAVYSAQVLKCVPHSFRWIEGALLFGRLLTRSSRGIVNINTCSFCFLVALAERI